MGRRRLFAGICNRFLFLIFRLLQGRSDGAGGRSWVAGVAATVSYLEDGGVFIGSLNLFCCQTTLDVSMSTPVVPSVIKLKIYILIRMHALYYTYL